MSDFRTYARKIGGWFGRTPEARRTNILFLSYLALAAAVLTGHFINPPPPRDPDSYNVKKYKCPEGTEGPYMHSIYTGFAAVGAVSVPYCRKTGPWHEWPKNVPALKR